MVRHSLWVAIAIAVITPACSKDAQPPFDDGAEVVPAVPPVDVPGHPVAAQYWGEIDPMNGRMELYRIEPGNVIHRGVHQEAVSYNGSGSATFNPGQLTLHTDQTRVTYKDSGGTCHSNGAVVNCSTLLAACNVTHMFCAPVQMTSSASFALPDVVLQFSQSMPTNAVTGCVDSGDSGLCFATGTCATPTSNQDKVDCGTSSFTSPITGNGSTTHGCSWCYGVASLIGTLPGLKHAVVPGSSSTLTTIDTPMLAMLMTNDLKTDVTGTVRYSTPAIQGSNLCYTRGTTMTISGGGFGPPGSCIADPPSSCPIAGAPGTGYQFLFPIAGGTTSGTNISWSDVSPSATVPINAASSGTVSLVTPAGTANVSAKSCPTLSDSPATGPGSPPGTTVTMTGNGYAANERVNMSAAIGQMTAGCHGNADANGHFSASCNIKCSGAGCGAGVTDTITGTGATSAESATTTFLYTN